MSCKYVIAGTFAVCGLTLAAPALADTQAGIEAWSRGDHAAAVTEWQAAAAKNDADALFDLGQAHKLGRGAPQDLAKAEGFYAQAAAQGHPQAGDNYGLLLFQRGAREQALPYLQTQRDAAIRARSICWGSPISMDLRSPRTGSRVTRW